MTTKESTQQDISKSLENPLLEAVKSDDLSIAMTSSPKKKKILPDQIPISLDKFENILSEKREELSL